ncbi:MAG: YicC family protein [Deltaproteobacteria bacterium]|nr:YicC family protein [Deltaproteobacteria bacterium]
MPHSMTGFGRSITEDERFIQQWEIRSVNSRHLDLKWRLPVAVRSLETRLEKVVRRCAQRGRVEISLILKRVSGAPAADNFDAQQATAMLDALAGLARVRGDSFAPDYNALLGLPMLWGDSACETDEELPARLEEGLAAALRDWNEARAREGRALSTDMHSRILRMEEWLARIEERAPAVKEERRQQLRERLGESLQLLNVELDESRFLQEVVILCDKLDVSEELTRLRTHLERLRELLDTAADAGRRLDFILQECFREISTCGNKAQDVQLSRLVVDLKNELEKCREQVQNLE